MGSGTWENKKESVNIPSPKIIELRLSDVVENLEAATPGELGLSEIKWVGVVSQGRGLWQWVEPEEPGWGRGVRELGVRWWSGSGKLGRDLGWVGCSEVGWGAWDGAGVLRPRGKAGEHPGWEKPTSEEAAVFEVLLDDDVRDSVEDKLNVLRVGGARHVGINLLHVASHVELEELHLDVVARVLVCVGSWRGRGLLLPTANPSGRKEAARDRGGGSPPGGRARSLTIVVREADAEMRLFNLLGKNVLLVEEEHDRRGGEVAVVTDAVEQVQALVHAVLRGADAVGHRGRGQRRLPSGLQGTAGLSADSFRPVSPQHLSAGLLAASSVPSDHSATNAPPGHSPLSQRGLLLPAGLTQALRGTHHFVVLHQHHVIGAQRRDEDDAGHTLEAVDPLLALRALPTHIEHPAG